MVSHGDISGPILVQTGIVEAVIGISRGMRMRTPEFSIVDPSRLETWWKSIASCIIMSLLSCACLRTLWYWSSREDFLNVVPGFWLNKTIWSSKTDPRSFNCLTRRSNRGVRTLNHHRSPYFIFGELVVNVTMPEFHRCSRFRSHLILCHRVDST